MGIPTVSPSIEYLLVGHVAKDLTAKGAVLGGTVAYAGLTAHLLGMKVGIVTSASEDLDLSPLARLAVWRVSAEQSTTFRNVYTPSGREQQLLAKAPALALDSIPPAWWRPRILHLAPIAREVDAGLIKRFPEALRCMTPQGWLRRWDETGRVTLATWEELLPVVAGADVVVLSTEDLRGAAGAGEGLAEVCQVVAVTQGEAGALVFADRDVRRIPAPEVIEVDPTGAGDIFAAAFFISLLGSDNPWAAAIHANRLAADSVTRQGLASVPQQVPVGPGSPQGNG